MRIGIQTVKATLFRGFQQEFQNVYYYSLPTAITSPSETLVDEIVAKEKLFHSSTVSFRRASVWTAGGTKAENSMIFQKLLTGAGATTPVATLDKERAILVRWRAGFDSRGNPVYLRKWYHPCGNFGSVALNENTLLANETGFTDAQRTTIFNLVNDLVDIGTSDFWQLVAKGGRERTGGGEAHKYLEHHQMGDQWR